MRIPHHLLIAAALLATTIVRAQLNDNEYRNSNNQYYWQNRKPDAAYWQQDVAYKIHATIHEDEDRIEGAEELSYWNNSPDTLTYVYFHLYENAFVKGSYLHQLERDNKVKPHLGPKEAAGLGTTTDNIQVDGQPARMELDNTIMKVYLPHPLYPGHKTVLSMTFNTYYDKGGTRRRMQMWDAWGAKHYNGCQWFPKLSVYDRMHGWDTYQHLNREFYGDFGLYDVTLDFPSNYVVEATGVLQNRSEVLPDTLRSKLDIVNFAHKKWNEPPSIITPYVKGQRKQWHFIGNNVHDFAFTADPSYRIGTSYWNGVECVALVQEPHASGWQNATDYITKIIKTFSTDIGMYCYPKIVAADAQDGMEYPMITMDGGSEPGYRGLLVHEIGHNWFYGQVGSNETYRAAMDEGFTQFLTAWGLIRIDGEDMVTGVPKSKYRRHFMEPLNVADRNVFTRYTIEALHGTDVTLNTHSDDFHNALGQGGGYGMAYFKTATMLYNLQYVLGDSLFLAAMQHYFDQWKFAHPYYEDFRASIIQFTHVDLSWFFDEWFETAKTMNYEIHKVKKIKGTDSVSIKIHRGSEMQMPLDLTVTEKNGTQRSYYIPNSWFEKQTPATVLPKWTGWGNKFNTYYYAHVEVPSGFKCVQIDTTYRLGDIDLFDNVKTKGFSMLDKKIKVKFDGGLNTFPDRRHFRIYLRPDLWWNPIDGVKVGAHMETDYLGIQASDISVWWNSHLGQENKYMPTPGEGMYSRYAPVNYTFNYTTPPLRNIPKVWVQINSRFIDGEWYHRGGFNWFENDHSTISVYAQTMWRQNVNDLDYLIYPNDWSSFAARPNSSLNFTWVRTYTCMNGNGRFNFTMRAPALGAFNYSYAQLEVLNNKHLDKLEIHTRVFGRYGSGNNVPSESALYMAGANPEELMENKYTRSVGFIPSDWEDVSRYDVNHFQQGGGLDLRGYAGYFAPDQRGTNLLEGYKGRSGAAGNLEIDFENYIPCHIKHLAMLHVNLYAFADAGVMELSNYTLPNYHEISPNSAYWSDVHVDAGLGTAVTIKNWGVFEKAKPLTIRLDIPCFLNRPPYSNNLYFRAAMW